MKRYGLPVYLGLLHGLNDALAGCLLAVYADTVSDHSAVLFAFLGYGLLAFGGQLPVGWLLDRYRRLDIVLYASWGLLLLAVLLSWFSLPAAILVSGLASALVHVSGGTCCYLQDPGRVTGAGIFNAPGVIGLVLGGLAGHGGYGAYLPAMIPVLLAGLIFLRWLRIPVYSDRQQDSEPPLLEAHDYLMLLLLLAITLRSLLWNIFYMLAEQRSATWLLGIGLAAFAGKLFGGWIADRANWKYYILTALTVAAILLTWGQGYLACFFGGIFFLQSAVPITLWAMQQYLWRQPAAATALCLGTAIILAGLPPYVASFRAFSGNKEFVLTTFVVLLAINCLWLAASRRRTKPS